jgi:hypothetical protein
MKIGLWGGVALACLSASTASASPTLNQVNDFQNGQVSGWTNGGGAADPVNVNGGGPAGATDRFLRVTSTGGTGPGSHLVTLNNNSRWTGNFSTTTDRIDAVTMDLKNFGTSPLSMRIAFEETGGAWYATTTPFTLPADGAWHPARFNLDASSLTRVSGTTALATALTRVTEFRILDSATPDYRGAVVASSFGVDNIAAVPEPGALAATCLATSLLVRRRRR